MLDKESIAPYYPLHVGRGEPTGATGGGAMETTQVEVWCLVDEAGNYAVGIDAEAAAEKYGEDVGESDAVAKRLVKVVLTVPIPKPVELVGVVPAEVCEGELKVA